ncbi:MAG: Glycine cleavage system H protein [Thermotoga sp. 47_83]|jgi:glycine cleavage system H protein|uniref:Glycine cleavage system H protein n=4 Tax=Thermotogaceae TaxID=188709 RepID=A5IKK9_THEP1|nr:glycine cleavage system H protein [Thermotoga petrophila RKU-1]ADA66934.1 glycine cleavage system H protein [Thermotoga petrophila RKU-10]AIY88048.1 glycine cleavage system protein H [Thermotoga sp. Cell2]KHC91125.1 glycine cleavage system protein H [Thermotoga sp. TBGT1765]KHC92038.1 glycine cleavage system protein H [Thermotoga sp. TBGT1766]KHC96667.1 glycine cleavage system protein H [Thermotoga sp. Xyl54]KUK22777.1 MAG: Glycine cleavage system H protein [Thermotoga petrophila]KUK33176
MKKYTKTHEWVVVEDKVATVGITNHAQEQLGDVVYVDLPEVGREVKKGEVVASIESVKAAADVYAPLSGKIVEVNEKLDTEPELLNRDPEGEGWLFKMEISDESELEDLLDEQAYQEFCAQE